MLTLKLVHGFGNGEGGITTGARLQLLRDGEPVDAGPWFEGAVGEFRHPAHNVLRRHFAVDETGCIVTSRDFSHLGIQEMTDALAHLLAGLRAAEHNGERLTQANERLQQSLEMALRTE